MRAGDRVVVLAAQNLAPSLVEGFLGVFRAQQVGERGVDLGLRQEVFAQAVADLDLDARHRRRGVIERHVARGYRQMRATFLALLVDRRHEVVIRRLLVLGHERRVPFRRRRLVDVARVHRQAHRDNVVLRRAATLCGQHAAVEGEVC